jgi:glycolate oxidase iron-sulfur subunit
VDPEFILTEADRCVKCGYCLPYCPTYALKADEGESPRGRIALVQGLVSGAVDSKRLHDHLDSCLACRACEAACPSEVQYGLIIASVRDLQKSDGRGAGALDKALLHTLSHVPYSQSTSSLTSLYQKSGLAALTSMLGGKSVKRLNQLLPSGLKATSWQELYPAVGETQGRVGLFTGCISRITDSTALKASIRILNQLGYEVVVPAKQGCCGAMHLNSGYSSEAEAMAQHNHSVFSGLELDAVVGVVSGCISHLKGYSGENSLSAPVMDISAFLCTVPNIGKMELTPLNKRVAIHTPCSMKNVLKQQAAPLELLQLIPEIRLFELPENGLCCGAAGLYVMARPDEADTLREDKIAGVRESQADILVTSNTGCSLHLSAGIHAAEIKAKVMHPVELLARQLPS